MAPASFVPPPLDQALPAELTGRAGNWLFAYRRYPVFGRPWMRGRWGPMAAVLLPVLALLIAPMFTEQPQNRPYGGVLVLVIEIAIPPLLGPWLGWRAQRHRHRPRPCQRDDRPPGRLPARRHPAPAQRRRQRRHAGCAARHRAGLPGPDAHPHLPPELFDRGARGAARRPARR